MKKVLLREILQLKNKPYVNRKTFAEFLIRLKSGGITRTQNPEDHFCSFFLPVNLAAKTVFLGHHIKANQWIPPGGHIENEESPRQTVRREFKEELAFKLTHEKVELFDIGISQISDLRKTCNVHYDFWYLVFVENYSYAFSRREFYTAGWLTIDSAIKKTVRYSIRKHLTDLKNYIHKL